MNKSSKSNPTTKNTNSLDDHFKTSPLSSKMEQSPNHNLKYQNSPAVVELAKCNQYKLLKSIVRGFKRHLNCFKPMERQWRAKDDSPVKVSANLQLSPNYYSEMNEEERAENIKSAIVYCKNKTNVIQDNSQQR